MLDRRTFVLSAAAAGFAACSRVRADDAGTTMDDRIFEVTHTDAEWRRLLTRGQYFVLRREDTELAFTSVLLEEKRSGVYSCAGCGLAVFASSAKFDSGTGWPSFAAPLDHAVLTKRDASFGMVRTSVICRRCGGHLGHLFDDGPAPTGMRYCINGVAMNFAPSP
ncbi:MAG: peptide-methionine (R)-S-oxide reductase MsrB [Acidobacteria bacterium]|nr:peptide-methionine (R)-S-oxide reductase MsrB [Acidobacteriota bacterium]